MVVSITLLLVGLPLVWKHHRAQARSAHALANWVKTDGEYLSRESVGLRGGLKYAVSLSYDTPAGSSFLETILDLEDYQRWFSAADKTPSEIYYDPASPAEAIWNPSVRFEIEKRKKKFVLYTIVVAVLILVYVIMRMKAVKRSNQSPQTRATSAPV